MNMLPDIIYICCGIVCFQTASMRRNVAACHVAMYSMTCHYYTVSGMYPLSSTSLIFVCTKAERAVGPQLLSGGVSQG